ncbi:pantothenate transporter liz1 [Lophiotrema nucula]|uniref:Pantothenate transporter liz1 n=1 Tax=Lophiotrema nucula TaxID=690887 RepID=A0A6A5ZCZ9_9PLEO|nr:pantothenate transporter liz1 [Lophiotrema nucula]
MSSPPSLEHVDIDTKDMTKHLEVSEGITWTPEEEKKLNKIAGMATDLKLTSNEYSIALVVFFVGYVIFEPPSNMVLVRTRPSIYLPVIMIIWGALTCAMAAVQDFSHLVILRVFVGVIESGFAPGILLIISSWYKREEQSKRFAVYMSAAILSRAFGGLLAGAVTGSLDGAHGIRGWRWLFIVEGAATIGWAICAGFILLDFPQNSKRLTERERYIAIHRLQEGGGFILGYMVIVGSSTLSYFYPTLVHGLGYTSTVQSQYMIVPIYAVAFVLIASWLTFSLITSILVCCVYNFTARYVLLVLMAAGLWASNAISLSFAGATFGCLQPEVRAIALALVNAMGNLVQIYGAYLFPSEDAPKYLLGFGVISGMLGFGVVVYILMHVLTRRKDGLGWWRDE